MENYITEDECTYPENLGLSEVPELHCRIGDEFQVEIPLLISKSTYITLTKARTVPAFLTGLPISLVWINDKVDNFNPKTQEFFEEIKNGDKGYRLVPGSSGATWSSEEEASFLLGLYIFGKDFAKVVKLVESKDMGEVLCFYYSRFYNSEKYKRWSVFRKTKSKRRIYGERIFSGSTQQQILSRLFLGLSEDQKNALSEVAKAYSEGKTWLEEFVFALKGIVGMKNLIEAVGIGKGKRDLTRIAMENPKSSQSGSIPAGKACSSLTTSEITNLLNGGFRLSKARSSELFWEAVWPRLLAKGWHSEKQGETKNSLVFLVPGVDKFLRRKLVKGEDFFDSVSDVLNKVASDPRLLEFENCENGDLPGQQRRCYLKPRASSCNSEAMKFTVVDTSSPIGEERKVRELRSLPVEIKNISSFRIDSEVIDPDCFDHATNESGSSDEMFIDLNKTDVDDDMFTVSGYKAPEELDNELKMGMCSNDTNPDKPAMARLTNRTRTRDRNPSTRVAKHRRVDEKPKQDQNDKPQPQFLIDLNIPLLEEIEDESITTDSTTNERMDGKGNRLTEEKPTFEQPPSMSCQRKSTRNRPLTTKALEALACGFLSIGKKKHRRDGFQSEDSMPRPLQRPRTQAVITEKFEGNERKNAANDMISEVQV